MCKNHCKHQGLLTNLCLHSCQFLNGKITHKVTNQNTFQDSCKVCFPSPETVPCPSINLSLYRSKHEVTVRARRRVCEDALSEIRVFYCHEGIPGRLTPSIDYRLIIDSLSIGCPTFGQIWNKIVIHNRTQNIQILEQITSHADMIECAKTIVQTKDF